MNAETRDTIYFGNETFINPSGQSGKRSYHELAVLLGSDEDGQFSLPVTLIYNEEFERVSEARKYLNSKAMLEFLRAPD